MDNTFQTIELIENQSKKYKEEKKPQFTEMAHNIQREVNKLMKDNPDKFKNCKDVIVICEFVFQPSKNYFVYAKKVPVNKFYNKFTPKGIYNGIEEMWRKTIGEDDGDVTISNAIYPYNSEIQQKLDQDPHVYFIM